MNKTLGVVGEGDTGQYAVLLKAFTVYSQSGKPTVLPKESRNNSNKPSMIDSLLGIANNGCK